MDRASDVMDKMLAIEGERSCETCRQRDLRDPPGHGPKQPVVGVVVADVDLLAVGRELTDLEAGLAAVRIDQRLGEPAQADGSGAADIAYLAVHLRDKG